MTITHEPVPWAIKGAVTEILDAVVFDFWTGQFPASQEMGVVLEKVRASLVRVHIASTLLRGVIKSRTQRFLLEVHNRDGMVVRRSYDRPVVSLEQLTDDDDKTVIDTLNNLLQPTDIEAETDFED